MTITQPARDAAADYLAEDNRADVLALNVRLGNCDFHPLVVLCQRAIDLATPPAIDAAKAEQREADAPIIAGLARACFLVRRMMNTQHNGGQGWMHEFETHLAAAIPEGNKTTFTVEQTIGGRDPETGEHVIRAYDADGNERPLT